MKRTNNNSIVELDEFLGQVVDKPSRDLPGNFFDCALQQGRGLPIYPRACLETRPWERGTERIYDVVRLKIRMLEDMVSYYHSHDVGDDDLDLISSVMCRAQDDLDGIGEPPVLVDDEYTAPLAVAYERALICLESKGVVFNPSTGAIGKYLEGRFGDGENSGSVIRSWGQLPRESDWMSTYGDYIPDPNAKIPYEVCDDHLLKERLREILNTLTDRERQVIDFEFGLSDGYSRTLEEVGRLFNVTRERIRQIEARALMKLRHPARMSGIEEYRNCGIARFRKTLYGGTLIEYRGSALTIAEWARLSHIGERRLHDEAKNHCVDRILDLQVAKVGDNWMYYLSAAEQKGIPRKLAEKWHREGMLAQEIADHYYKEVVLKYDGRDFSMEELVEMTRLPRSELKRRIGDGWSAKRILTERMVPSNDIFCDEVDIGNVRMTIGDWMRSFGIEADDLLPFIEHNGLYVAWSRKAVWAAVGEWLKIRCLQDSLSYDSVMEKLGSGWSWKQIIAGQINGIPANKDLLLVEADGRRRMRLLKWYKIYSFSEDELIAETNCVEGWNVVKVREFLRKRVLASKNRMGETSKITWRGETKTVDEWSKRTGIPVSAIKGRISQRWVVEDVLGIPYPCGPIVKLDGRIYTKKTLWLKFGIRMGEWHKYRGKWDLIPPVACNQEAKGGGR